MVIFIDKEYPGETYVTKEDYKKLIFPGKETIEIDRVIELSELTKEIQEELGLNEKDMILVKANKKIQLLEDDIIIETDDIIIEAVESPEIWNKWCDIVDKHNTEDNDIKWSYLEFLQPVVYSIITSLIFTIFSFIRGTFILSNLCIVFVVSLVIFIISFILVDLEKYRHK